MSGFAKKELEYRNSLVTVNVEYNINGERLKLLLEANNLPPIKRSDEDGAVAPYNTQLSYNEEVSYLFARTLSYFHLPPELSATCILVDKTKNIITNSSRSIAALGISDDDTLDLELSRSQVKPKCIRIEICRVDGNDPVTYFL